MLLFIRLAKYVIITLFGFALPAAQATTHEQSPYVVLEKVGNQLFNRIASNQQEIKKFPEYMRVIIEEELTRLIKY